MNQNGKTLTWVVYRMTVHGKSVGATAVCEQHEWDAMELARPGYHTLIRAGITNEGEAETLARSAAVADAAATAATAALAAANRPLS